MRPLCCEENAPLLSSTLGLKSRSAMPESTQSFAHRVQVATGLPLRKIPHLNEVPNDAGPIVASCGRNLSLYLKGKVAQLPNGVEVYSHAFTVGVREGHAPPSRNATGAIDIAWAMAK